MKIGLGIGGRTIADAVANAQAAEADGFASVWFSHIFGLDAMTACAMAGNATGRIELGTFVVPTFPRHPQAMAQQASSTSDAAGGRFTLGIGLSHQVVIETMLGLSFARPAKHMEEYLAVLLPLLREGKVSFKGDLYSVNANLEANGVPQPPPVIVAALGPKMLQLTGANADGTATWTTGVKTLGDHIVPTITKAAEAAGRPAPRIVAGLPVCVTEDPDAARELAARQFAVYGTLPSYRAMLDREGAADPGDIALVGDEAAVATQVAALADAGVTDFGASLYGSGEQIARGRTLLAELAARG
ncbi:MAG TPA: TIGR03564 family F420-dependent LLM class oxidoreductase [Acidimicrobiales bacterium]|nr:TIGR03564 family F420-dependent LLM class oxidoreductase [Acidimicrobiales bacterium]